MALSSFFTGLKREMQRALRREHVRSQPIMNVEKRRGNSAYADFSCKRCSPTLGFDVCDQCN
jgi:hypothetical protein